MNQFLFLFAIFLASFIPRTLPIFLLRNREISPRLQSFLDFIPVCIFTALVATDIFFWEGSLALNPLDNIKLLASFLVLFVSFKFRNLFVSMLVGVVAIAVLGVFL